MKSAKLNISSEEIMLELKKLGNEQTRSTFLRHGAPEPVYGVKVEDLKKIWKNIKSDYELSMELYATGNSDAMYLAAMIADPAKMSRDDLRSWVLGAGWYMISEFAVAATTAQSPFGLELGLEWINSSRVITAAAGWGTLNYYISMTPNDQLSVTMLRGLMERIRKEIHSAENRVRYAMNGLLIALGGQIPELTEEAIATGRAIGKVSVDMGNTACKVPSAPEYIEKIRKTSGIGKKRKYGLC